MSSKDAGTADIFAFKCWLSLETGDMDLDSVSGCVQTCGAFCWPLCILTWMTEPWRNTKKQPVYFSARVPHLLQLKTDSWCYKFKFGIFSE